MEESGQQDATGFLLLAGVAQIFGIVAVVLTGVWTGHKAPGYLGGFAWHSDPGKGMLKVYLFLSFGEKIE